WVERSATYFVTICAASRGINLFANDEMGKELIRSAASHHFAGIWWLHLFLVMPDHIHALLAIAPNRQLGTTITAWKSYQTKYLQVAWQSGFFDHRIRGRASHEAKAIYIRQNPVRAGLVATPEAWPYSWTQQ
ncbi:MAG TPA: hypothetical protein VFJ90_02090, partial [Candidatus Didemnitutus sp.]|nr:hypothetical protein [Candidatus Didemnitutus sp.]